MQKDANQQKILMKAIGERKSEKESLRALKASQFPGGARSGPRGPMIDYMDKFRPRASSRVATGVV